MEKKVHKKQIRLLPNYFKKIGLLVFVLPVMAFIIKVSGIEFSQTQREMFRILSMNIIILGFSFIACSKDRIEDELIVQIRLIAMATSFIFAICYVIINPIIDLIFQDPIKEMTGQQLIGSMLGFYLIVYYLLKRKR